MKEADVCTSISIELYAPYTTKYTNYVHTYTSTDMLRSPNIVHSKFNSYI